VERRDRIKAMLKRAYELASQGRRPQMIEAVLAANGFPEAAEFIEQHQIKKELLDIADRARRERLSGEEE
jgi:hypothetical protein